jgi:hypothetical protein
MHGSVTKAGDATIPALLRPVRQMCFGKVAIAEISITFSQVAAALVPASFLENAMLSYVVNAAYLG